MNGVVVCSLLVATGLLSGPLPQDTMVEVSVPQQVSTVARSRLAGNDVAVPILVLEGIELGAGEGITIRILGPPKARVLMGIAGMVGRRQRTLAEPLKKVTLTVPLTDRALRLLADAGQVRLTLKVDSPDRPALNVDHVYFRTDPR
jgi:hypothetical protein